MRLVATRVRQLALLVALTTPVASTDAQIAIQVRNGTVWATNIEIPKVQQLSFRWRWDGAETPTRVAWQLATQLPASTAASTSNPRTAATRASDAVASESPLKLPSKTGVYQDFAVTLAVDWPAKFYVRVRVDVDRKTVYSRWINVSVFERASLVVNPKCAMEGWQQAVGTDGVWGAPKPLAPGGTFGPPFDVVWVYAMTKNSARTEASYKRKVIVRYNGVDITEGKEPGYWQVSAAAEAAKIRTLAAGKTDTVTIKGNFMFEPVLLKPGRWDVYLTVTPVGAPESACGFQVNTTKQ